MKYEAGNQNSSLAPTLLPQRIASAPLARSLWILQSPSGQKQFAKEQRWEAAKVDQIISELPMSTHDTERA